MLKGGYIRRADNLLDYDLMHARKLQLLKTSKRLVSTRLVERGLT